MDAAVRPAAFDLALESLTKDFKRTSFFQLNKLFERCLALSDQHADARVRFTAKKSLAFPASDIDSLTVVETTTGKEIEVNITFMGLFGPASPLPAFYTERLLQADDDSNATAQFLDMFNHHIVSLLQQAWEKYRYYSLYKLDAQDRFSGWMFKLSGVDTRKQCERLGLDWTKLLPLMGLMTGRVKNASTLKTILEHYFDGIKWDIEECIQRRISIPDDQFHRMGVSSANMGMDIVLGDEIEDQTGKFRVHVYFTSDQQYEDLLPGSEQHQILTNLISFYLRDQLEFDLCLHCSHHEFTALSLDENQLSLGWNSVLGEQESKGEWSVVV